MLRKSSTCGRTFKNHQVSAWHPSIKCVYHVGLATEHDMFGNKSRSQKLQAMADRQLVASTCGWLPQCLFNLWLWLLIKHINKSSPELFENTKSKIRSKTGQTQHGIYQNIFMQPCWKLLDFCCQNQTLTCASCPLFTFSIVVGVSRHAVSKTNCRLPIRLDLWSSIPSGSTKVWPCDNRPRALGNCSIPPSEAPLNELHPLDAQRDQLCRVCCSRRPWTRPAYCWTNGLKKLNL